MGKIPSKPIEVFLLVLFMLSLAGCSKETMFSRLTSPKIHEAIEQGYICTYYPDDYGKKQLNYIIQSEKELEIFSEYIGNDMSRLVDSIDFSQNMLLVQGLQYDSSSVRYIVNGVVATKEEMYIDYDTESPEQLTEDVNAIYVYAVISNDILKKDSYLGWFAPSEIAIEMESLLTEAKKKIQIEYDDNTHLVLYKVKDSVIGSFDLSQYPGWKVDEITSDYEVEYDLYSMEMSVAPTLFVSSENGHDMIEPVTIVFGLERVEGKLVLGEYTLLYDEKYVKE